MWGNYYNYGYGAFWPGNLIGFLIQVFIAVILISVIVRFVRRPSRWGGPWGGMHDRTASAEELLKERFVKGEISKDEYAEKLKVIRDNEVKR